MSEKTYKVKYQYTTEHEAEIKANSEEEARAKLLEFDVVSDVETCGVEIHEDTIEIEEVEDDTKED